MTRFDQAWCDALLSAAGEASTLAASAPIRLLYVVTDTEEGKVAFYLNDDGAALAVIAGKPPRGEKADVTITAKESVLSKLWSGDRSYDAAFMAGDIKVEGSYARWIDELVPIFAEAPWADAWAAG